ncbi:MAG TPA: ABC transporter substrate-binding protein [Armatimonadota bacterium]|nr:ABC transporter substrate-binding protein [Armatimonadota bacterium]
MRPCTYGRPYGAGAPTGKASAATPWRLCSSGPIGLGVAPLRLPASLAVPAGSRAARRVRTVAWVQVLRCALAAAALVLTVSESWAASTRVAVVKSRALSGYDAAEQGFMSVIGAQTQVSVTRYSLSANSTAARQVAAQIKANPPQVVLVLGTEAAQQVGKAVGDIPVVFAMVVDPVQSKLMDNPGRPGGNMTGVHLEIPASETLQALRRVVPTVRIVGVIYDPSNSEPEVDEITAGARSVGLRVVAQAVRSAAEVPAAAGKLRGKVDAIYAPIDTTVYSPQSAKYVLLFAVRNGLPVAGFSPNLVQAGALLALYPDYTDIGRQAGYLALRIISGEAPGRIPVVGPRKSLLALNLSVARALGLTVPETLRRSADKVFK